MSKNLLNPTPPGAPAQTEDDRLDAELLSNLNQKPLDIEVSLDAEDEAAVAARQSATDLGLLEQEAESTAADDTPATATTAPAVEEEDVVAAASEVTDPNAERLALLEHETQVNRFNEAKKAKLGELAALKSDTDKKLDEVRTKLAAAIEAGNTKVQLQLQEDLADLKSDVKDIMRAGQQVSAVRPPERQAAPPPLTPKAQAYLSKNTWLRNPIYASLAQTVMLEDARLASEGKHDKNSDEYFSELNRRLVAVGAPANLLKGTTDGKQAMPTSRTAKPNTAAVRPSAPASKGKLTLTANDQSNMKKLGLNPQDPKHAKRYAMELARANTGANS